MPISLAVLLPVVAQEDHQDTLDSLRRFAESLVRSTPSNPIRLVVYLSIDPLDTFLLSPTVHSHSFNTTKVVTLIRDDQHLLSPWNQCANAAFKDGCDFIALMNHQGQLPDEPWIDDFYENFLEFSTSYGAPFGFGTVTLRDDTGLPIFPVLHRTHMEIFNQSVMPHLSPDEAPEFFYQLYRRFRCSTILSAQVTNITTDLDSKSFDSSLKDWSFETLDNATATVEAWLKFNNPSNSVQRILTLDVVIPSFRVIIPYLRTILDLKSSNSCSLMFFIIIDNPASPYTQDLQALYAHRSDVRIRVNTANLGTSATRNRGINESAADWIHFLDDDIVPRHDLFLNVESHLRANPDACGLVGVTDFPIADTISKAALHISAAVYFFSVATRLPSDVPWSVSANLVARRSIRDNVRFKTLYPKTGGGEDIDFCLSKRAASKALGRQGFVPAPDVRVVHPWWPTGRRAYWRFYVWSYGDELLTAQFPEHVYTDYVPNSAESLLLALLTAGLAACAGRERTARTALYAAAGVVLANTLHDCARHLVLHRARLDRVHTSLSRGGLSWFVAVVESSFIRLFRDVGWFHGMLAHGRLNFFRRFDINGGRYGTAVIREERSFRLHKIVLSAVCTLALMYCR